MRIDLNHGAPAALEGRRTNSQVAAAAGSATKAELGEDQAQLSGAHTQVQALAAQASQLPEVREERIYALRQAVESGRYHASPEIVGAAMFEYLVVHRAEHG